ncbi:20296_t:CDS:2 [Entrophospora sp. SA101]|nr:2616_t:CDS:2 [Entrophospora sp. SA101]CAJ0758229.1 20296_t:CDS:2 [Entrophospora sp. SA101]CAJ0828947.1 3226_t:CDS:2 [Entrophospora sp. SA101]CAJ0836140.1 4794_t:CDS:2 [Entrophospora sp. SA101]
MTVEKSSNDKDNVDEVIDADIADVTVEMSTIDKKANDTSGGNLDIGYESFE